MKKYKKLIVFDMDGTMLFTPDQTEGEKTWLSETGLNWPYPGSWWGRAETLDMDVFKHIPINQWIYNKYLEAMSDEDAYVILATGRLEFKTGMRKNIERILRHHNLSFGSDDVLCDKSGVHLNTGGDTFRFKTKLFERIANELNVDEVIMYDDRHEHLVKFYDWAEKQPFDVSVVDAIHKKVRTFENK